MKVAKKPYERPQMTVVELRQRTQLMAGSFTGDRGTPYGNPYDY